MIVIFDWSAVVLGGEGFTGFAGPKGRIRVLLQFKLLTTVLTLLFYCQVVNKIQMSHHGFTKKRTPTCAICRGRQFQFFQAELTVLPFYANITVS